MGFKPKRVPHKPSVEGWSNLGPDNVVRGWAVNHASLSAPVRLILLIDEAKVATVEATESRSDVPFDNKRCGFELVVPSRYFDGKSHKLLAIAEPEGVVLSTRTPTIELAPASLPRLRLNDVTASYITGRFLTSKVVKAGGVWLWTGSGLWTAPQTEWLAPRGGEHPFRIELGSLSLKDLLEQGAAISQGGDHTQARLASLWSPAVFDWLCESSICVISVSGPMIVPDGCRARVAVVHEAGREKAIAEILLEVVFRNNVARFELPSDISPNDARFTLRTFVGDQTLSVAPCASANKSLRGARPARPANLIGNADFRRWSNNELPMPMAGRFETALGWTIDNTQGGFVTVAPAPLALLDPNAPVGSPGTELEFAL